MTENKIKVNNLDELITKAKEYVASQGGAEKVRIGKTASTIGIYRYVSENEPPVQTEKGGVEITLYGQNNSWIRLFLEDEREETSKSGIGKHSPRLVEKILEELRKIIPDNRPTPPTNNNPKREKNDFPEVPDKKKEPKNDNWKAIATPCSSLFQVKNKIKEYYQKNQAEINQNPDFSHWVNVSEMGIITNHSTTDKDGKTTHFGPSYTATISLKEYVENGTTKKIILNLEEREPQELEGDSVYNPENELKNYWKSLVENKENNNNPPQNSPSNSPDKDENNQSEIEGLKTEISDLEKNSDKTPEQNQDLENKKKKLKELQEKDKKTNEPKDESKDLEGKIAKLKKEIADLEKKTNRTSQEEQALTSKKQELEKLQKELAERKKRNNNSSENKNKSDKTGLYVGLGILGVFLVGSVAVILIGKRKGREKNKRVSKKKK